MISILSLTIFSNTAGIRRTSLLTCREYPRLNTLFISCKVSDIKTEALNELAILRDRFGGKGAKAAIVSAGRCNAASRHRAAQPGIAVIDRDELESGQLPYRLKVIMKVEDT